VNLPDLRPWTRLATRILGDYRIFQLAQEDYSRPDPGRTHSFYVLFSTDWVNVVPVTPEGRVVLIRQFRPGSMEVTIEVPGGMVEPGDRDPAESARRELEEETGYTADRIVKTGAIRPNPAILRNRCHQYVAFGARPLGRTNLDEGEDCRAFEADWDEVDAMVEDGRIDHALVLNAIAFAKRHIRTS
jgi:8-oxo-dGTP pyrophosphatase MutT (NUDIX family)